MYATSGICRVASLKLFGDDAQWIILVIKYNPLDWNPTRGISDRWLKSRFLERCGRCSRSWKDIITITYSLKTLQYLHQCYTNNAKPISTISVAWKRWSCHYQVIGVLTIGSFGWIVVQMVSVVKGRRYKSGRSKISRWQHSRFRDEANQRMKKSWRRITNRLLSS